MLNSPEAEELLVFTCAVESLGGTYIHQNNNGPALGIYQMEPTTYFDLWQHYIKYKSSLLLRLTTSFNVNMIPHEDRLIYDLRYATAMARIFYARVALPLPPSNDIDAIWSYYKSYYNTPQGKADKMTAIDKYHVFLNS